MPVNPPYSIVDTIARLRAEGGAAWGKAAQSVGTSIGSGLEQRGRDQTKEQSGRYHDATMFADKNFDWQHSPPQDAASAAPQSILRPAGGGAPPAPRLAAPGAPAPAWATPGAANSSPPPPPPAAPRRAPGSVTMNDIYLAHGLKPVAGGDNIIGTAKAAQKAEAAGALEDKKIAGAKDIATGKSEAAAKLEKDKEAAKSDATHMEVDAKLAKLLGLPAGTYPTDFVKAKVGADQRKGTGETAAKAKTDVAEITANARRQIAEISFRLKSPDHQIQLQAMKDRDAYITKHPTEAALFGTPAEIGKVPSTKEAAAAPKSAAGGDDLDALMVKHGGQ